MAMGAYGNTVHTTHSPAGTTIAKCRSNLCDLEPARARAVPACNTSRGLSKVPDDRTLVVYRGVERESHRGASIDCYCGCAGTRCAPNVAAHVRRGSVFNGGVEVGISPDVLVFSTFGAVGSEPGEAV